MLLHFLSDVSCHKVISGLHGFIKVSHVCTSMSIKQITAQCFRRCFRVWESLSKAFVPEDLISHIIIIFLHGLGRLICSGIDALPSFPGASTISSSSRFVVEGVFRESGVVRSFKVFDPVIFFIWVSRLVFQRSLVLSLWLRFLFYPALCIL